MAEDSHYAELQEVYRQLISRAEELRNRANEAENESDSLHAPEEINAEADGVMYSVREIESLLNKWNDEASE